MLDEIASEANIMPWIHAILEDGCRLMGFGHRVYRTRDPRADALKEIVRDLKNSSDRIAFAEAVENGVLEMLAARYPDVTSIPMSSSIPPWCSMGLACRVSC